MLDGLEFFPPAKAFDFVATKSNVEKVPSRKIQACSIYLVPNLGSSQIITHIVDICRKRLPKTKGPTEWPTDRPLCH